MCTNNDPDQFYLGVLELALGDRHVSVRDLVLLIAPNDQAAELALKGHIRALADGSPTIAVPAFKVESISYAVYSELASHLITLSIFKGAAGGAWKRELRVAVEGDPGTIMRSWWTARELQQVVALMAVARQEKMTEARQHMNVDLLDRTTLSPRAAELAQRTEIVVSPFANKVAFAVLQDLLEEDARAAEVRSTWIGFPDLARLFEPGVGPVEI